MTPRQAMQHMRRRLEKAGIEAAGFESRILMETVLGWQHGTHLLPESPLNENQLIQLTELTSRRCAHEPLQYLCGVWEFYGLSFVVGKGVLIPRQDTEILVETALSLRQGHTVTRLLDLCSGSGCIPCAIASKLSAVSGDVLELSEEAIPYLQENLQHHAPQMHLHQGDVLAPPACLKERKYDLITCNPPYLSKEDMANLQPEVEYEPKRALYGGEDGLDFYRALAPLWIPQLQPGGWILFEVGQGQANFVYHLLEEQGLVECRIVPDYAGIERVVLGKFSGVWNKR
jgi:release factor glutamine methyltransferase